VERNWLAAEYATLFAAPKEPFHCRIAHCPDAPNKPQCGRKRAMPPASIESINDLEFTS